MFNFIVLGLLLILIVIWICTRLKNWKQRLTFLFALIVGIPAILFFGFKWGWNNREKKLKVAEICCRQKNVAQELNIIFSGFKDSDLFGGISTMHKDSIEKLLSSETIQIDTTKGYDGTISAFYHYKHSFQTKDIIEISIGKKQYRLSNFVLTANANYNMGGAVVSGCRIDSMDINGKRTSVGQNFIIHKTDQF